MHRRLVVVLTTLLALVLSSCGGNTAPSSAPEASVSVADDAAIEAADGADAVIVEGLQEGNRLPDVELVTLSGETIRVSNLAGQPLIINFWATWCPPCRQEMPLLQATFDSLHPEGLQLIAITDQPAAVVQPFVETNGITFPIIIDTENTASRTYRVQGLPTTLFLDSNGVITARHTGLLLPEALQTYLAEIMPTDAATTIEPSS